MPKVKRIRSAALESRAVRQEPLGQQSSTDRGKYAVPSSRNSSKEKKRKSTAATAADDALLDSKSSRRILELSQEQQLEMQAEEMMTHSRKEQRRQQQHQAERKCFNMDSDEDEEEDEKLVDQEHDDDDDFIQHDEGYVSVADGALGLSAEDEALVAAMMRPPTQERRTLADIILEKIEEKEAAKNSNNNNNNNNSMNEDDNADHDEPELPPKVVEVYTEIGKILSRYTSGKLPKAFKVIPSLSNWEDVLYLTRPDMWTPQAMYQATRIFASNLNPKMAQRFYHFVLLDAVRADIYAHKKLNYHYYMALKKSVYKPAAFFKGILLPLCQDDANCTLREAAILASVLQRVSIPVHHSAVAIHKLATACNNSSGTTTVSSNYNGATSIFIKTLLNKKYSLPAPVIGSLVQHFASFINYNNEEPLPVLWHQALLVFVQRYKNELQKVARESLSAVMKKHYHYKITPEIRRELYGAQAYKEERASRAGAAQSSSSSSAASSITTHRSGGGGTSMQVE